MINRIDKFNRDQIAKYFLSKAPVSLRGALFKLFFNEMWHKQQEKRNSESDGYSLIPFDKHKCIFVHIPKCAGVSVSQSLFGCLAGGHMEMWKYQLIFGEKTFNEYFKFGVVRNPWDRVYSAFCFLKSGGYGSRDKKWFQENVGDRVSFEEFVKKHLSKKHILNKNHFSPQVHYLRDINGTLNMDYIARFERLSEEISVLSNRLNISSKLVRSNVTKNKMKSYNEVFSSQMIQIVADVYSEDVEILNYRFNNIQ